MSEATNKRKQQAASASVGFNLLSTLFKLVAAMLTGSVALLSEAVHSITDVIASLIAFVSVKAAAAPPDEEHPYGHGKIESLAGFGESIMLLLIVVYIVFEAIRKLLAGESAERLNLGMVVMAASAIGSFSVGIYVARVAKDTKSLALQSNGQHLHVDAFTSLGVLVALAITQFSGWKQADGIMAILLAVWIAFSAWKLSREAFHQLIDRRLPGEDLAKIDQILRSQKSLLSYHRLRSRLSGDLRYVDVHIVVPNTWSVVEAHELADRLETEIEKELTPAVITVHVDPYDESKQHQRNME